MCSKNADKKCNNCDCIFCEHKLLENNFAKQLIMFLVNNDKLDMSDYITTQITKGTIPQQYLIDFFHDRIDQGLYSEAVFVFHFIQKPHKLELPKCTKNVTYSRAKEDAAVRRSFLRYIQSVLPTASDDKILEIRKILD